VALPWCGVCFFGIGTGFEFSNNAERAAKRAGTMGAVALLLFFVVRLW
jgi:hypothetical protein